ncbi:hypothetical protein DPX16_22122 [Anabarilius grahami]|uniref:Uncharacterized protein n=1 Tax=Anabarilius grahami TaxID=495550 RepID=A0A3N0XNJ1_ANAGA|nr:hypothetical protein DPX16_22122 [Anabarilius grahami]
MAILLQVSGESSVVAAAGTTFFLAWAKASLTSHEMALNGFLSLIHVYDFMIGHRDKHNTYRKLRHEDNEGEGKGNKEKEEEDESIKDNIRVGNVMCIRVKEMESEGREEDERLRFQSCG